MWDWPAVQTLLTDWPLAATQAGDPGEQEAIPLILASARRFLAAYQEADGPVPSIDFDMLLPFIRCVRIQEILFNLEQARLGQPWSPAYTLHNLLSLENLEGPQEAALKM